LLYESARTLYRGRGAVPLQTFTSRHSNRKLSIIVAFHFVNHFYAMRPGNYQIR